MNLRLAVVFSVEVDDGMAGCTRAGEIVDNYDRMVNQKLRRINLHKNPRNDNRENSTVLMRPRLYFAASGVLYAPRIWLKRRFYCQENASVEVELCDPYPKMLISPRSFMTLQAFPVVRENPFGGTWHRFQRNRMN